MRHAHHRLAAGLLAAVAAMGVSAPASATSRHPKPQCIVPKLTGDTLAKARRQLTAAHCTLGTVREPETQKGETLIVSATNPKAGKRRKNRARVSVTLGIKRSTVPTTTTAPPVTTTPTTTSTPTPPALTATYLDTAALALGGETASGTSTAYFQIDTSLSYFTPTNSIMYLVGLPVAYTLVDQVTGATVETFQGTTTTGLGSQGCAIGYSISSDQTTLTLTGEPINPETGAALLPACFSGALTVPDADPISLNASFAGNSTYAASTATQGEL